MMLFLQTLHMYKLQNDDDSDSMDNTPIDEASTLETILSGDKTSGYFYDFLHKKLGIHKTNRKRNI